MKYVVKYGEKISSGYHKITQVDGVLYGELGAKREIISLAQAPDLFKVLPDMYEDIDREHHKWDVEGVLAFLGDGYAIKTKGGASVFLVHDGKKISDDFHSFWVCGEYLCGQLGSVNYVLQQGKKVSEGYQQITVEGGEFYGRNGTKKEKIQLFDMATDHDEELDRIFEYGKRELEKVSKEYPLLLKVLEFAAAAHMKHSDFFALLATFGIIVNEEVKHAYYYLVASRE